MLSVFGIVACLVIVLALVQLVLLLRGQQATRSQAIVLCVALIFSEVASICWIFVRR